MATLRFAALQELSGRTPVKVETPQKLSDFYGINVFDLKKMEAYLPAEAYQAVIDAIEEGTQINRKVADQIANGMCRWAKERGATHYTHWFQPLNDATAERHERLFDFGDKGEVIERFSGKLLIQQEPDASSFPNGGLRNTFEARGYTAWDVSSPAFIVGSTLCIPTIFIAYTGEALDYKTPLIRALNAVDKAAVRVCQYFDKDITKVTASLGWEQEYFLIDEALYNARPDLCLTGRTLMGHASAKDQQLEDHYFGSIPTRVMAFMSELELEAHKLAIPLKTHHNEAAPNQFECAPIFEEANLANDHNQLLLDLMKHIAAKHHFAVLLHEKPFIGINGSGKHNNWSLHTNTGINLFSPAKNPKGNMLFLAFIVNTLKAVHQNQDLLRASIMSEENSHRLGTHEAPPAIISVFLGTYLTNMLDNLAEKVTDSQMTPEEKTALKLGIARIPEILLDNTDRNRTSPFAFTGNRFEFRAVGSSANCGAAMTILNAVVANQLILFANEVDSLINQGKNKDEAIFHILKRLIIESRPVRFEGDGYSQEWVEEATKRGLTNITSAPEAIEKYASKEAIKLLTKNKVLTETEIHSRVEVEFEKYTKKLQIEARVLGDLAINHIIPTAIAYQTRLIDNICGLTKIFDKDEAEALAANNKETVREIGERVVDIKTLVHDMVEARKKANTIADVREKTFEYNNNVRPFLTEIRFHIDKLEEVIDDEIWTLPKYRELLFMR